MKRIFISLILFSFILLVAFYFFGSSPNMDTSAYNTVKKYNGGSIELAADTIKVITYNIGYLSGMTNNLPVERTYRLFNNNLERAVELILEAKPHIIGFQEIDFAAERSFLQNQLDSIAEATGYPRAYKSINWDKRYVPFPYWPVNKQFGSLVSGQAILTVFPMSNEYTVTLSRPVNATFLYKSFYLDRLIQVCDLKIGSKTIKVMNLHMEAFDEETRIAQAEVVKELYDQYADKMPVLLIGDFNSRNEHEDESNGAMKIIMEGQYIESSIADSAYLTDPELYYTFDSRAPYQMIDYILYNRNFIQRTDAHVLRKAGEISDHLPVVMKFVLRQENGKN